MCSYIGEGFLWFMGFLETAERLSTFDDIRTFSIYEVVIMLSRLN